MRSCSRVSPEKNLAAASDAVAEIHAGYVVAGTAFKVVLLAVFGLDEIVPGAAGSRLATRAAGQPRGVALPYVLRTFNPEFALISHYGKRKCVASKCGVRAPLLGWLALEGEGIAQRADHL